MKDINSHMESDVSKIDSSTACEVKLSPIKDIESQISKSYGLKKCEIKLYENKDIKKRYALNHNIFD